MFVVCLLFFVTVYLHANAQVPFLGKCPECAPMDGFEADRYLGKWYEIERYFAVFEFGGKCVTADYIMDNNGTILVTNQQISAITGIRSTIEGLARIAGGEHQGRLAVTFPSLPVAFDAPYWVLDTDYKNYAVVWSCVDFGFLSTRNAWILTRMKHPSLEVMEKAYSVLDKNGISRAYFIRTDQKNCPKQY